ncbi:hypothetical protein TNCV_447631 [Trichonephila clavipes]|nr:hypothetical protein TNCV_447631 [Trichonephila clavipes]
MHHRRQTSQLTTTSSFPYNFMRRLGRSFGLNVYQHLLFLRIRYIINLSVSDNSLNCKNLTESSLIEESIAVDRFDWWRAQNIVPRANGSPSLV